MAVVLRHRTVFDPAALGVKLPCPSVCLEYPERGLRVCGGGKAGDRTGHQAPPESFAPGSRVQVDGEHLANLRWLPVRITCRAEPAEAAQDAAKHRDEHTASRPVRGAHRVLPEFEAVRRVEPVKVALR